jgi:uncharacterized Zn ribbon protein
MANSIRTECPKCETEFTVTPYEDIICPKCGKTATYQTEEVCDGSLGDDITEEITYVEWEYK